MSDINKIKEENANKSSKQVNAIKAGTKKALSKADSQEQSIISKAVSKAASNVVSSKPIDEVKMKMKSGGKNAKEHNVDKEVEKE